MTLSQDASLEIAKAFFDGAVPPELHLQHDVDQTLAGAFGVDTLPTSILVVEGRQVARFRGKHDWDASSMRELLEKLMMRGDPGAEPTRR